MSLVNTAAGELGTALAEVIRETARRATSGSSVAAYIEGEAPVKWAMLSEAGWDLTGVVEDEDSATLRDLVEIAFAWGDTLLQLPLITSIMAKRHSAAARGIDGPVTFAVRTPTTPGGRSYLPFGQVPGIAVLDSLSEGGSPIAVSDREADHYAPSLLGATAEAPCGFSTEARYELSVVWAAEAAGIARRALLDATEFTKQRFQFGKPVGSFQAVKHHLANAHIAAQIAETAAIWASLDRERAELAVAQSFAESLRSLHLSTQVYGGLGFTWEMGVHFSLRHVTMLRDLVRGVQGS
jgi:hypothetical protein